ncbi:hypothetical protein O181_014668 [Austropuccinia psidii MF-1]|uniref:Retrovirus-related Pol polyprotein from transposon TNT 1-94-like beta-barrel domain-containing protein n=1 Tax=Austropuccinia psidii MF-1 TaxID=1389203 RepID=A0A9Q3GP86_9BASI|nr:hypothetical protein [Austropuccinia psidii MF-1]
MRNLKGSLYDDSSTMKSDPIKLKQSEMVYYFIVGHLDDENYDKFVSEDENDPVTLWKNIKDYYASSSAENIASVEERETTSCLDVFRPIGPWRKRQLPENDFELNNHLTPGTGIALAACNSSGYLSNQPILDSGCSNTIAPTNRDFLNTKHSKETLLASNGNRMEVVSEGMLCLKTSIGNLLIQKSLVIASVSSTLVSLGPYLNNGATLKGYK